MKLKITLCFVKLNHDKNALFVMPNNGSQRIKQRCLTIKKTRP
jgi:hypothetical protein